MNRPTPDQMKSAVAEAERLRAEGDDTSAIGHALLYLTHRCEYLEKVREAAERYVHFGLAEAEHTRLIKALDNAKAEEGRENEGEEENLGLG